MASKWKPYSAPEIIQENLHHIQNVKGSAEHNAERYVKLGNEMFYLWGPNLTLSEFGVSLGQLLMT